jgi:hypothetical protein
MRQLRVKVIPSAKKNSFQEEGGIIKVYLNAPAVDGKANKALISFLAEHFQIKKSCIEIIKGLKSRHKTINISNIN